MNYSKYFSLNLLCDELDIPYIYKYTESIYKIDRFIRFDFQNVDIVMLHMSRSVYTKDCNYIFQIKWLWQNTFPYISMLWVQSEYGWLYDNVTHVETGTRNALRWYFLLENAFNLYNFYNFSFTYRNRDTTLSSKNVHTNALKIIQKSCHALKQTLLGHGGLLPTGAAFVFAWLSILYSHWPAHCK